MLNGAGYLVYRNGGLQGELGMFYNYILAGNGVFLDCGNAHLNVTMCIAPVEIRGLEPMNEIVVTRHGLIPRSFYELALSTFLIKPIKERFIAVTWDGEKYSLAYPDQDGNLGNVNYSVPNEIILDMHSHCNMPAFFSGNDNRDDQGFKLSMVLGKVEREPPEYRLRVSAYGYFKELDFQEVFDCTNSTTDLSVPNIIGNLPSSEPEVPEVGSLSRSPAFFQKMRRSVSSILTRWKD